MTQEQNVQDTAATLVARLDGAVEAIRARADRAPRVGIVLGSGLGGLVDAVDVDAKISYPEIPGFAASTVAGHAGALAVGRLGGTPVAVMAGRVHLYEGYPIDDVVFPIRVLVRLGAEIIVVTNASGGIHPDFRTHDFMVIRDHLNLTGRNPLVGPNVDALGPRFPDMTAPYDTALAELAHEVARRQGIVLRDGVYAGVLGPSFETPAEIRMLRTLGADAVGMSTVNEVIAVRHMGARVLGLSCITNLASGLSESPLSHEDVSTAARQVGSRFTALVTETVQALTP